MDHRYTKQVPGAIGVVGPPPVSELKTEGREFHSHLELGIFPDLSGVRFLLLPNYKYFDKWRQSSSLFIHRTNNLRTTQKKVVNIPTSPSYPTSARNQSILIFPIFELNVSSNQTVASLLSVS